MLTEKTRITVVDDETLVNDLLSFYFREHEDIEIINMFSSGESFITELRNNQMVPDIVLLELKIGEVNGMEVISLLKSEYPSVKIIVVSSFYKETFMGYMFKLGVNAFTPKNIPLDELISLIKEVRNNDFYFTKEQYVALKDQISSKVPKPKLSESEKLTERELEVLKLICEQRTTVEIADKLFVTKRTVEGHRSNLLLKTCTKNTVGLVIWAVQNQVININDYVTNY